MNREDWIIEICKGFYAQFERMVTWDEADIMNKVIDKELKNQEFRK